MIAMKKICFLLFIFSTLFSFAQLRVKNLLCEHLTNPLGIDVLKPRLSWQLESDERNVMQSVYEIRVGSNTAIESGKNIVWNSGKVASGQSTYVPYAGSPLASGTRYYWQVRVWDKEGKSSAWSTAEYWEMGLLNEAGWKAKWIEAGYVEDSILRPSPLFRKTFEAAKLVIGCTA
jgi:alpha-L-rhamnosidase